MEIALKPAPRNSVVATQVRPIALIVAGMHRSGTSAFGRCLSLLGVGLPQKVVGAGEANERGHWEPEEVVGLNDRFLAQVDSSWDDFRPLEVASTPSWLRREFARDLKAVVRSEYRSHTLYVMKDPRISRMLKFYDATLRAAGHEPRYLLCLRHPTEVIASLGARNGMWPGFAALLWLRHMLDAERQSRGCLRAVKTYDGLLADWAFTLSEIGQELNLTWPVPLEAAALEIEEFISGSLRHHWVEGDDFDAGGYEDWVRQAYQGLLQIARGEDAAGQASLDLVRQEFDTFCARNGDLVMREVISQRALLQEEVVLHRANADSLAERLRSETERSQNAERALNDWHAQAQTAIAARDAAAADVADAHNAAAVAEAALRVLQERQSAERAEIEVAQTREREAYARLGTAQERLEKAETRLEGQNAEIDRLAQKLIAMEEGLAAATAAAHAQAEALREEQRRAALKSEADLAAQAAAQAAERARLEALLAEQVSEREVAQAFAAAVDRARAAAADQLVDREATIKRLSASLERAQTESAAAMVVAAERQEALSRLIDQHALVAARAAQAEVVAERERGVAAALAAALEQRANEAHTRAEALTQELRTEAAARAAAERALSETQRDALAAQEKAEAWRDVFNQALLDKLEQARKDGEAARLRAVAEGSAALAKVEERLEAAMRQAASAPKAEVQALMAENERLTALVSAVSARAERAERAHLERERADRVRATRERAAAAEQARKLIEKGEGPAKPASPDPQALIAQEQAKEEAAAARQVLDEVRRAAAADREALERAARDRTAERDAAYDRLRESREENKALIVDFGSMLNQQRDGPREGVQHELHMLRKEVATLKSSTSWKVSAPVRLLGRMLGRGKR